MPPRVTSPRACALNCLSCAVNLGCTRGAQGNFRACRFLDFTERFCFRGLVCALPLPATGVFTGPQNITRAVWPRVPELVFSSGLQIPPLTRRDDQPLKVGRTRNSRFALNLKVVRTGQRLSSRIAVVYRSLPHPSTRLFSVHKMHLSGPKMPSPRKGLSCWNGWMWRYRCVPVIGDRSVVQYLE